MTRDNPDPQTSSARNQRLARAVALAAIASDVGLLAWSYTTGGIFRVLLDARPAADKITALGAFFDQFGLAAPLVYLLLVIVEVVVAPIPGTMLYAPGGILFGGFLGGTLSLAGNIIGAGLACQLMRVLIGHHAEKYFERSALAPYEERITRRGAWVVFLLRVNPLTSSDLVSYAAGLTHLPVWKLMLGTLAGMGPLCYAQSYLAEGLLTAFPSLIYPLIIACAVYALFVIWIVGKLVKG